MVAVACARAAVLCESTPTRRTRAATHGVRAYAHDAELGSLPCHTILIVQEGIHIIESLYLEELAAEGVREFGFICLPLKLRGGTGSPVRPIALV